MHGCKMDNWTSQMKTISNQTFYIFFYIFPYKKSLVNHCPYCPLFNLSQIPSQRLQLGKKQPPHYH